MFHPIGEIGFINCRRALADGQLALAKIKKIIDHPNSFSSSYKRIKTIIKVRLKPEISKSTYSVG